MNFIIITIYFYKKTYKVSLKKTSILLHPNIENYLNKNGPPPIFTQSIQYWNPNKKGPLYLYKLLVPSIPLSILQSFNPSILQSFNLSILLSFYPSTYILVNHYNKPNGLNRNSTAICPPSHRVIFRNENVSFCF